MVTSREEIHEAMKKMKMGRTPEQDCQTECQQKYKVIIKDCSSWQYN
jgi:hypothetical protein